MKIIKRIFLSLFGLIGLVVLLTVVAWLNPAIILTQSRVDYYFGKFAGSYFAQKPEHLELKLNEYGFTGKRVRIALTPFCLSEPYAACFRKVHFEFAFKFVSLSKIRVDEFGPVEILNESFTYHEAQAKKEGPDPAPSQFNLADHLALPTDLKIKDIDIEFPKVIIEQKNPIHGQFFARGKQSDKMIITADASSKGMKAQARLDTAFVLNQENPFKLLAAYEGAGVIQGNLRGFVNWANLYGNLEGQVLIKKFIPWLDSLTIEHLVLKRNKQLVVHADLDARLEPKLTKHRNDSALPKATFDPHIQGKLEGEEIADSHIQYKVLLGPLAEKGIHLAAQATGTYPFPDGEEYYYGLKDLLVRLDIPQFQTLVQSLKHTNSAIPAPFAVMGGSVHFMVGNADAHFKDTLPISLVTDLDSKEQTLKTESLGELTFVPSPGKMKIAGNTVIKSFRFTLPDLDMLAPTPGLKKDDRIISVHDKPKPEPLKKEDLKIEVAQRKEASSIDLNWKIRTDPSGIKLYYPVLKPFAPIEVKWDLTNTRSGEVKLLPFTIEFLKRQAQVKSLRYYITPGDPTFHYEGHIEVPKTEYTIFIDIIQDGEKPKIQMTSDPPLPQSDIVSVLLFNQTAAELDSEDTTSVASTQSAVTNRVLGIFTILTLSSTPIEAVNFNPSTGIYSARVKIGNGLSATVGTDWDKSQEVALRKRLGRNFVLSTIFQTDQVTNSQTTKTLIEWFRRY